MTKFPMSKRQKWQNVEKQNVESDKTSKVTNMYKYNVTQSKYLHAAHNLAQDAGNLAQYACNLAQDARNLVQDAHTL